MRQASCELVEIILQDGLTGGYIHCPQVLIPSPGQYLLAHDGSDSPLAVPVFSAGSTPGGFLAAPPLPPAWRPGLSLALRGPLGQGFSLPSSARKIALVALGETAARLRALLVEALEKEASVVLISDSELTGLPPEVEVRPFAALVEVAHWADYLALDLPRESLPGLREKLGLSGQAPVKFEAQVLVHTPMPCGEMAACGVCAVTARRGWKMACKDGPVFGLSELI